MVCSSYLYRGFVGVQLGGKYVDLTVFAIAMTRIDAKELMLSEARVYAPHQVIDDESIYNLFGLQDLINEHLSEDIALRAFECGVSAGNLMYIEDPQPILIAGCGRKSVTRAEAEQLVRGFVAAFHPQVSPPKEMARAS